MKTKGYKVFFSLAAVLLFAIVLSGCLEIISIFKPEVRYFSKSPAMTAWKPVGIRPAPSFDPVVGSANLYRTLHGNVVNNDEVSIAFAPVFEYEWTAEENLYVIESPTFDSQGNLYVSPLLSHGKELLVSVDRETGRRNWAITGDEDYLCSGTMPLVLDDPDNTGDQIVYVIFYDRGLAVRPNGDIVWETPTGLTVPPREEVTSITAFHSFGTNYHPASDAVIAFMGDGRGVAIDRATGALLSNDFRLPGAPSPKEFGDNPFPDAVVDLVLNQIQDIVDIQGMDPMEVLEALMGGGTVNANFFSIVPQTSRIWVAATAPDEVDGTVDNASEYGALYSLNFSAEDGFQIVSRTDFDGGSSSTPALSADGRRVYVADSFNNMYALDDEGHEIWSLNVGSQIFASIAVASDNNELYAVTTTGMFKVIDRGDHGTLEWFADLDPGFWLGPLQSSTDLCNVGIGANGVMIQVGAGYDVTDLAKEVLGFDMDLVLPMTVGNALIDRVTGDIRYIAEGREECLSTMCTGPDGAIYLGHSPFRRVLAKVFMMDGIAPITGGIGKYAPIRLQRLVMEAAHAGADRADNLAGYMGTPGSDDAAEADIIQIGQLIDQAEDAAHQAYDDRDMDFWEYWRVLDQLNRAAYDLGKKRMDDVAYHLRKARDIAD